MFIKRLLLTLGILIFLAIGFWGYYTIESQPVDRNNRSEKIFVIRQGESLSDIARNLEKEEFIKNRVVFYIMVKKMGLEKKIQAGDFKLSPSMKQEKIIKTLTHGTLDVWVTVIEGLRKEEIAEIMNKKIGISTDKFLSASKGLEGFLFPDTYLIPKTATANLVVSIMKNNFNKKYQQALKKTPKNNNLSKLEIVTLASLIEKEGKKNSDKMIIGNILYKRLINEWPLQIDATIQYVLGYQKDEKTWWKKNLTNQDLKIDSLYNTYKYKGLPPGPICNPGLISIEAALSATGKTPYWFYISDKKGNIHFSKTVEEHSNKINNYLN